MATIQIREIPDATYEVIRRRARARALSIQAYMREEIIEMASQPSKAEAFAAVEGGLERFGPADTTVDRIVADVTADRRG